MKRQKINKKRSGIAYCKRSLAPLVLVNLSVADTFHFTAKKIAVANGSINYGQTLMRDDVGHTTSTFFALHQMTQICLIQIEH